MPDPFYSDERFRIVERETLSDLNVRVKYIFPDGSSQYVTFRPSAWTSENEELTGHALADDRHLRVFR